MNFKLLLLRTRREFHEFYALASNDDSELMDSLMIARATLEMAIKAPRAKRMNAIQAELERMTNEAEQLFTRLREQVRTSDAFHALSPAAQRFTEQHAFDVQPPNA